MDLTVNGRRVQFDGDPATPLLWALRDHIGLTGTKFGCGAGLCGACTVHVDGAAVRSCVTTVAAVAGRAVTTIEGLADADGTLHPVQQAWVDHDVAQCGYCQTGQVMAVAALLARHPRPTDADLDRLHSNICRCGTWARMRPAIHAAAARLASDAMAAAPAGEDNA